MMAVASPVKLHNTVGGLPWMSRVGRAAKRLRPSVRMAYLLSRPISLPPAELPLQMGDFTAHIVRSRADGHYDAMLKLAEQQGLDEEWCLDQFHAGAAGCVAMRGGSGEPGGMGFVTVGPFFVAEIDHDYTLPAGGCYLYATYVSPACRGQRVQRLVDLARMAHAARAHGSTGAFALVSAQNKASLRGHGAGGFATSARVSVVDMGRLRFAFLRPASARARIGSFKHEGKPLRAGLGVFWPGGKE